MTMSRSPLALCMAAALAIAASTPALAAKLYKWVDKDGNVTYSQERPPGVKADSLEIRTGGPSDDEAKATLEKLTGEAEAVSKDRNLASTVTKELKERDERIKKNCEVARENKRILESAPRVQDTDAEGNPYFVDDATRAARIATAEDQIRQYCQ